MNDIILAEPYVLLALLLLLLGVGCNWVKLNSPIILHFRTTIRIDQQTY